MITRIKKTKLKVVNKAAPESYIDRVARIEKHMEVSFACSGLIDTSAIARSLADYEIELQRKASLETETDD